MTVESRLLLDRLRRFFDAVAAAPDTGAGCVGHRVCVSTPLAGLPCAYVPVSMCEAPEYEAAKGDAVAWQRLR